MIERYDGFIEDYVSTPLEVCEQRDIRGLHAKARAGLITGFTRFDDPYEAHENPETVVAAARIDPMNSIDPEEATASILRHLSELQYVEVTFFSGPAESATG